MFDLRFTEVVQMRPDCIEFAKKTSVDLRHQNVTGVAAIHYALREIDSRPRHIFGTVDVGYAINQTRVKSHSDGHAFSISQRERYLHGGTHRRADIGIKENERHSITRGKTYQGMIIVSAIVLDRIANGLAQLLN